MERTSISNNLKPKCFVAAIDFGTTYSGYAFLTENEFQTTSKAVNSKIHCSTWVNEGRLSYKAPTSVLFRPTKTVHSFGYDAERYYTDNPDDIDFKEWYFFKHFRTKLSIDQDVLTKHTLMEDSNESGHKMKAVDVFAAVINYFKDHLLHVLRNFKYRNNSFEYLNNNDIHWVITVPVIWDLKGKQFMKVAAEQAGISGDQLTLVLEPEAVMSYCHASVVTPTFDGMVISTMQIGSQSIVVNSGGATTDITVYEVIGPRMLEEIHQSHYDGDTITDKFVKFLTTLLGEPVIKEIRDKHPSAYVALMSNFDDQKQSFSVQEESKVNIRVPFDWIVVLENKTGKTLKETIRNSSFNGTVRNFRDKLVMKNDFFRKFFDYSINKFLDVFEELLRKPAIKNITTLLVMRGDFESSVLINAVKQKFPNLTVIVPEDSDLAVLKGAVLYGFEPYTIAKRNNTKQKCVVAAIDFGTTNSGYAFLTVHDFNNFKAGNSKIHYSTWEPEGRLSYKAPTSVLFRPNKTFHSFGFDADKYYTEHSDDIDFKEWYFFKYFKSKLNIVKDVLTKDTLIEDSKESGRRMKALDVFAAVINYFKDRLLKKFKDKNDFEYLNNNDIHWVITVPVIWDLKGNQLMKDAAEQAGISDDQLTLVLEPEAALSYYHDSVDTPTYGGKAISAMQIGSRYIVVNSGGATTDITVYEVTGPKILKEIQQIYGCQFGGNTVTAEFVKCLTSLFGEHVIKEIHDNHPSEYLELMSEFEHKKTSFYLHKESVVHVTIRLPCVWAEVFENNMGKTLQESLLSSSFKGTVHIFKDKLRISNDLFCKFFDYSIHNVLGTFEEIFRKQAITNITLLAVGGDFESSVLINAIKQKFPNLTVIVPPYPDLAVLNGAVLYGFEPYTITKREIQEKDMASGSGKISERRAMDSEDVEFLVADMGISEENTDSQYKQLTPIVENDSQECTNIEDIPHEDFGKGKYRAAQAPVIYLLPASVFLKKRFYVKMSINGKIYDCVQIESTLVLTDYKNNQLIICKLDGSDINHIPLPDKPNNLTEINSKTVAVSCRNDESILIVNITTGTITSKLKTNGNCYGISCNHNNLYVVIVHSMIQVMDLNGTEMRSIPLPAGDIEDITVDRNRLVCIDCNTIYCCSLDGKLIWKFKKDKYQDLRRVTTDGRGTVYVTNGMTDNVVVVSKDGKYYRELITSKYRLNRPSGIHFSLEYNVLLVCNDGDGMAFVFYVEEKTRT